MNIRKKDCVLHKTREYGVVRAEWSTIYRDKFEIISVPARYPAVTMTTTEVCYFDQSEDKIRSLPPGDVHIYFDQDGESPFKLIYKIIEDISMIILQLIGIGIVYNCGRIPFIHGW